MGYDVGMNKMMPEMSNEFGPDMLVVPSAAFEMPPKEKLVYSIIHWLWINGQTKPSNAVIGYITGLSSRSVTKSKTTLKKAGLIEKHKPLFVQKKYVSGRLPYCYYCGEKNTSRLEGDHYIPRSKGGTKIVLACRDCNAEKGAMDPIEFEREKQPIRR